MGGRHSYVTLVRASGEQWLLPKKHITHRITQPGKKTKDPVTTNKGSDSAAWAWQGTRAILGPELHSPLTTLLHWSILRSISSYGGIRGHLSVSSNRPWGRIFTAHIKGVTCPVTLLPTNHGFWDIQCWPPTQARQAGAWMLPSISCSSQGPWRYLDLEREPERIQQPRMWTPGHLKNTAF